MTGTGGTLRRYLLFQLPGWIAAALAAWLAVEYFPVSPALAALGVVLWIAKDFALFPWLRVAYERPPAGSDPRLLGAIAVTDGPLDPEGYVRVEGELWRARLEGGGGLPAGARVRVRAVEGLTVRVVPDREEPAPSAELAGNAREGNAPFSGAP